MAGPRVLCFGEVLMTRWLMAVATVEEIAGEKHFPGGAPANVAAGLVKLGTPSALLSCVGLDPLGQTLVQGLEALGVNLRGLQRSGSTPTRLANLTPAADHEIDWVGFDGMDPAGFADAQITATGLAEALFVDADYLVLDTIPLAYEASAAALERSLALADQHYVKLFLDVNWRSLFWPDPDLAQPKIAALLHQVDFLKLTSAEAEWLVGTASPEAILQRLDQLEGVIVTPGFGGVDYAFRSGAAGHNPGFRTAIQDTLGSGDAFVAGLVHWLTHHSLLKLEDETFVADAIRYASAAASLSTTRAGSLAAQATDAEIQAFLVGRTA